MRLIEASGSGLCKAASCGATHKKLIVAGDAATPRMQGNIPYRPMASIIVKRVNKRYRVNFETEKRNHISTLISLT